MLIKKNNINNVIEKIKHLPYKFFKPCYKSIIPLKIFQTWHTKDLPPKMREIVESLKSQNPRFKHYLFDDNDCREFIRKHFDHEVLNAYDSLIPGAYKADLWRYCVLYIHGGIYLDIKLNCINGFKLIELTEKNHLVRDRLGKLSIYNALMACQKGSPFLWKAIYRIVINVNKRFYGKCPLEPTGPVMLGNIVLNNNLLKIVDMSHYKDGGYILYKNRFIISTEYPEYDEERRSSLSVLNIKRYADLWNERSIYR
jgi:mannosyltransferase OCH1-like enzyme